MKKPCALLLSFLLFSALLTSCSAGDFTVSDLYQKYFGQETEYVLESGVLAVHFFDVGQGDSEFIQLPNGETILIDAGESNMADRVISNLEALGVSEITYIIATHPHSDHIGGLADVIDEFEVGTVYMPDAESSSYTYENLLSAIAEDGCAVAEAKSGVSVINEENLQAYILSPSGGLYNELNNYSAVLKLTYYNVSYLFMGDAEEYIENEIAYDVSADVVKVGHHGSSGASSYEFTQRVGADYAVFEVGAGNSYGHPTSTALSNWRSAGAEILRTDQNGNIILSTDGSAVTVLTGVDYSALGTLSIYKNADESAAGETAPEGTAAENTTAESTAAESEPQSTAGADSGEYKWVLNTGSKKVHTPECRYAKEINSGNYKTSDESLAALEAEGYSLCKVCSPSE